MKKSQAIKVVATYLKTLEDCKITRKHAETVIDLLEGLGMEPPLAIDFEDEYCYLNQWEKESNDGNNS